VFESPHSRQRCFAQWEGRRDAKVATIGNGHLIHCAQDPPAVPQRMERARMENKKWRKRRQHTVRRRRNPERSKRARIKDVPDLACNSEPWHIRLKCVIKNVIINVGAEKGGTYLWEMKYYKERHIF